MATPQSTPVRLYELVEIDLDQPYAPPRCLDSIRATSRDHAVSQFAELHAGYTLRQGFTR